MYKYQLPKEFGEKWVAALRSGEYRQGNQLLYSVVKDSFCCLGVACDLVGANRDGLLRAWIPIDLDIIPVELRGSGADNNFAYELSKLNDKDEKSFPEIADWIIENVEFVESEVPNA